MAKNICEGEKYILGGPNEDNIGLPISLANLPETIELEGQTLVLRSAFHTTLVAISEIIRKNQIEIPGFVEQVVADFCEFVKENKVDLIGFRDEFRFATENERRSVIAMCEIANLNKFFDLLNKKYDLELEYPPTHVTLYTLKLDEGIFLTDAKDMEEMTKEIPNPGLDL
jgi:hypothetical protein